MAICPRIRVVHALGGLLLRGICVGALGAADPPSSAEPLPASAADDRPAEGAASSSSQRPESAGTGVPASPWSFNVGLFSQYASRGISYTHERPAVQAMALYTDPNGWYLGFWVTNVSRDFIHDGSIEDDPFGGYAGTYGNWSYDIGFWRWTFPDAHLAVSGQKYDTVELYAQLGWKNFSLRYWREVTDFFGLNSASAAVDLGVTPNGSSRGSNYWDGNATFDLPKGFELGLHAGRQIVHRYGALSYSEWRASLSKDFGRGWVADLAFSDTNADPRLYRDAGGLNSSRAKLFGDIKKNF